MIREIITDDISNITILQMTNIPAIITKLGEEYILYIVIKVQIKHLPTTKKLDTRSFHQRQTGRFVDGNFHRQENSTSIHLSPIKIS